MSTKVQYIFGRRQVQEGLPGHESGAYDPFVFTVILDRIPFSWHSAYSLLSCFRKEFVKACKAAETSTCDNYIEGREIWIPTGYLDRPTIVTEEGELLLNGEKPNRWLSPSR